MVVRVCLRMLMSDANFVYMDPHPKTNARRNLAIKPIFKT